MFNQDSALSNQLKNLQKSLIAHKIKKLELINIETAALYNKDSVKSVTCTLEDMKQGLLDEPKVFMDALNDSNDLVKFEADLDSHIELATTSLNELKGVENV